MHVRENRIMTIKPISSELMTMISMVNRVGMISAFVTLVVVIGITLLPHQAHAQESRIATQSGRCSAIFSVLADTAEDPAQQQRFQRAAAIFIDLFVKESKSRQSDVTLDAANRRRDEVLKEFRDTHANRRSYLIEESVLCGAWGEGFLIQGENYGYVPVIPKVIPHKVRSEYETTAASAFTRWMR
jgi:hypothetical protein